MSSLDFRRCVQISLLNDRVVDFEQLDDAKFCFRATFTSFTSAAIDSMAALSSNNCWTLAFWSAAALGFSGCSTHSICP